MLRKSAYTQLRSNIVVETDLKQEIQESDRVKYSFRLDQLRKTLTG